MDASEENAATWMLAFDFPLFSNIYEKEKVRAVWISVQWIIIS